MTTVIAPRRDALLTQQGIGTTRFSNVLEDIVSSVNNLLEFEFTPVTTQQESLTFALTDANTIIRKTVFTANQTYRIPARTEVEYELGTWMEVHNDTGGDLIISIDDDILQSSLAATELTSTSVTIGPRSLASFGFARFVLVDIVDVTWKITGDQMT